MSLADDIAKAGFSWKECGHALCVQIKPGDKKVEDFNRTLCEGSGLAPILPGELLYSSLSCGHTTMGCRAIQFGMPSNSELLSEDGHLSCKKLEKRGDLNYIQAVNLGLKWKVLKHQVRDRFMGAMVILQAGMGLGRSYETSFHWAFLGC